MSNPVLAPCQAVRPVVPPSRTSRHRAASPQSEPLHVPVQWLLTSSGVVRCRIEGNAPACAFAGKPSGGEEARRA